MFTTLIFPRDIHWCASIRIQRRLNCFTEKITARWLIITCMAVKFSSSWRVMIIRVCIAWMPTVRRWNILQAAIWPISTAPHSIRFSSILTIREFYTACRPWARLATRKKSGFRRKVNFKNIRLSLQLYLTVNATVFLLLLFCKFRNHLHPRVQYPISFFFH